MEQVQHFGIYIYIHECSSEKIDWITNLAPFTRIRFHTKTLSFCSVLVHHLHVTVQTVHGKVFFLEDAFQTGSFRKRDASCRLVSVIKRNAALNWKCYCNVTD